MDFNQRDSSGHYSTPYVGGLGLELGTTSLPLFQQPVSFCPTSSLKYPALKINFDGVFGVAGYSDIYHTVGVIVAAGDGERCAPVDDIIASGVVERSVRSP